jgi:hypothetical protein
MEPGLNCSAAISRDALRLSLLSPRGTEPHYPSSSIMLMTLYINGGYEKNKIFCGGIESWRPLLHL